MGGRVVYGNSFSENGWPMVDELSCQWVEVPGTDPVVTLEIQQGQPLLLLRAFVADWNAYIEHVRDADSACWTATNSVASSNHLSGTACDVDWDSHPFQVSYAGFNQAQIDTMREMLAWYEDTIFWGQDWDNPKDSMHIQCGYNTYNNPHTQDFINRKIRADGFSLFRRGGEPQPVSGKDQVALLIIREGQRRGYNRDEIIACISTGIQESGLDQGAIDSTGHIGVYQQNPGYPNRNTAEGNVGGFFDGLDGKRHSPGASADIWKNIFWLQQAPGRPSADAAYEQGRQGYLTEIKSRINAATQYYDRLVGTPQPGGDDDELNQDQDQMLRELHDALYAPIPSRCIYAPEDDRNWELRELMQNVDGGLFDTRFEDLARGGDMYALGLVAMAAAGRARLKDSWVIRRATTVLAEIEKETPDILRAFLAQTGTASS